jgi:hypothetical protein
MVSYEWSWFLYCWVSAPGIFSLASMHVCARAILSPLPSCESVHCLLPSLSRFWTCVLHVMVGSLCFPQRAGYVPGSSLLWWLAVAVWNFLVPCGFWGFGRGSRFIYKFCHDNLFLTEGCFFFHQALVFQASIVCKLCYATSSLWCNENCYLPFVMYYAFHPIGGW